MYFYRFIGKTVCGYESVGILSRVKRLRRNREAYKWRKGVSIMIDYISVVGMSRVSCNYFNSNLNQLDYIKFKLIYDKIKRKNTKYEFQYI